jgi:hypothetical protein
LKEPGPCNRLNCQSSLPRECEFVRKESLKKQGS